MKIKRWDIIIIGLLLIISFLPYIWIKNFMGHDVRELYAYITVEGEPIKEIPLTGQVSRKEFLIETKYGKNLVIVENESIAVTQSDCSDHVCEMFGFINRPHQSISCLPHKLYIGINGTIKQTDDMQDA